MLDSPHEEPEAPGRLVEATRRLTQQLIHRIHEPNCGEPAGNRERDDRRVARLACSLVVGVAQIRRQAKRAFGLVTSNTTSLAARQERRPERQVSLFRHAFICRGKGMSTKQPGIAGTNNSIVCSTVASIIKRPSNAGHDVL